MCVAYVNVVKKVLHDVRNRMYTSVSNEERKRNKRSTNQPTDRMEQNSAFSVLPAHAIGLNKIYPFVNVRLHGEHVFVHANEGATAAKYCSVLFVCVVKIFA